MFYWGLFWKSFISIRRDFKLKTYYIYHWSRQPIKNIPSNIYSKEYKNIKIDVVDFSDSQIISLSNWYDVMIKGPKDEFPYPSIFLNDRGKGFK